jgi:hypothetical protein
MKTIISAIGFVILLLGIAPIVTAVPNSNSIIEDDIEYYIQTDKSIYDLGENVNIFYRVSNLTNQDIILGDVIDDPFAYYDFRVTQGDNWMWRYPFFSGVMETIYFSLESYEIKEFQTFWNMTNDNGTPLQIYDDFPVDPGFYNVVGEVALWPKSERLPVSVSINVIPEPTTLLLLGLGAVILRKRKK